MSAKNLFKGLAGVGLLFAAGCETLPECDEQRAAEARQLVEVEGGGLLYAGQALMNASCASGVCHNADATGAARLGAPAELDFDLFPARTITDGEPDAGELARLRRNQQRVFDDRESIWDEIESGRMPPDGEGNASRAEPTNQNLISVDVGNWTCTGRSQLPSIVTPEGKRIMESWLACGSPVAESSSGRVNDNDGNLVTPAGCVVLSSGGECENSTSPSTAETFGQVVGIGITGNPSTGVSPGVGQRLPRCEGDNLCTSEDCGGGVECDEVDPTWTNVFEMVYMARCVDGCHSTQPGAQWPSLPLEDKDAAYAATVGQPQALCSVSPSTNFIEPGDPDASYLLNKMEFNNGFCPNGMPLGALEPVPCLPDLVRAWIAAGAPND